MKVRISSLLAVCAAVIALFAMQSCTSNSTQQKESGSASKKIAVLLVNHGSRSETWRNALLELEKRVEDSIMLNKDVVDVKTAFMEYTEPSIATRLREFDSAGITDVVIVPVFLTVSSHSFDDIPTIIGQKEDPESMENLKIEKIERYTPKAKTYITPLLDFPSILEHNIMNRVKAISKNDKNEGLVMIAYGDQTYNKEWSALMDKVGAYVKSNSGITDYSFGWCGHIAHYNPDSTTVAIERVLSKKPNAVVIPVLVAHDEMFQIKIIGDGIAKIKDHKNKVIYKPDAILPDMEVDRWVVGVASEFVNKVNQ